MKKCINIQLYGHVYYYNIYTFNKTPLEVFYVNRMNIKHSIKLDPCNPAICLEALRE